LLKQIIILPSFIILILILPTSIAQTTISADNIYKIGDILTYFTRGNYTDEEQQFTYRAVDIQEVTDIKDGLIEVTIDNIGCFSGEYFENHTKRFFNSIDQTLFNEKGEILINLLGNPVKTPFFNPTVGNWKINDSVNFGLINTTVVDEKQIILGEDTIQTWILQSNNTNDDRILEEEYHVDKEIGKIMWSHTKVFLNQYFSNNGTLILEDWESNFITQLIEYSEIKDFCPNVSFPKEASEFNESYLLIGVMVVIVSVNIYLRKKQKSKETSNE